LLTSIFLRQRSRRIPNRFGCIERRIGPAVININMRFSRKIYHQTDTVLTPGFLPQSIYVQVLTKISKINKDNFEWIEEWHNEFKHSWLTGV
jgi:hypothetical protein